MKKITISIFSIALCSGAWAQALDRSVKPKPAAAPEVKLGKTESFTLPNGMKVFVVENHKLPTIACNIELDIRPELEGDMAGYRDMMSELLTAGTATRTKDQLNTEIDQMGARLDASSEGISASGLAKYKEKIMELMADVAMNAKISEQELELTKKKAISGLETEKNEPDAMVRNVSAVVNYGSMHPYGEVPTEASISKINAGKCQKYHKTYFRPNVAYMAIVGDVTLKDIKPLVEKYFGKWEKAEVPRANYAIPLLSAAGANHTTKVDFAPRQASVQSVVSVTYPIELKPGTPDVVKARVANNILGGGSQGRLFLNLREKHAWTYGAYSDIRDNELGGVFSATVKCRNAVSDSSVGAILEEMKRLQQEKITEDALQNAISYMSGNFAIALEDPKRIAQFAINTERYNMPKDYYRNYLKNLSAVTAQDVQDMAKKYITPGKANIVVAGSKEEVAEKLARFSADGKIAYYDYSGKAIVPNEMMAAPAGMTADDVFKKYVAAKGGEQAIASVTDIKIMGTSEVQGMPITITEVKKAPNKWKQTIELNMNGNKMMMQKQVYNGTKGYQEVQGKKADMDAEDQAQVQQSADFTIDLHPEVYGIKRTLKGMELVDGNKAYVLEAVDGKGKKVVEYYDATSSLLVKKVQGEGEKMQTSTYSDYREVPGTKGFKVPFKVTEMQPGAPVITETVQTVEANKSIPDTEFN